MARYVAVLFAVGVFAAARFAQAQPTVWLDMTFCPDLDEAEVQRIFAADLGSHLRVANEGNATRVVVTCRNSRIALRVLDPLSRKLTARTIAVSLADERAQARLVAIAASELVLASWAELEVNPTPRVEPEGARPKPEATQSALVVVREHTTLDRARGPSLEKEAEEEEATKVFRGLAIVSTRGFWQYEGRLWGGGVRVGDDRLGFISWSADALFEQGSLTTSAGPVELSTATLGGTLFFFRRWRWLTGRVGVGLRPGITTSGGTTTISPWGWPMLAASVSVQPSPVVFEVAGEAGHAVLPVLEQGVDVTTVRGWWASLQLGVGLAF